jgi:hypothetical protein
MKPAQAAMLAALCLACAACPFPGGPSATPLPSPAYFSTLELKNPGAAGGFILDGAALPPWEGESHRISLQGAPVERRLSFSPAPGVEWLGFKVFHDPSFLDPDAYPGPSSLLPPGEARIRCDSSYSGVEAVTRPLGGESSAVAECESAAAVYGSGDFVLGFSAGSPARAIIFDPAAGASRPVTNRDVLNDAYLDFRNDLGNPFNTQAGIAVFRPGFPPGSASYINFLEIPSGSYYTALAPDADPYALVSSSLGPCLIPRSEPNALYFLDKPSSSWKRAAIDTGAVGCPIQRQYEPPDRLYDSWWFLASKGSAAYALRVRLDSAAADVFPFPFAAESRSVMCESPVDGSLLYQETLFSMTSWHWMNTAGLVFPAPNLSGYAYHGTWGDKILLSGPYGSPGIFAWDPRGLFPSGTTVLSQADTGDSFGLNPIWNPVSHAFVWVSRDGKAFMKDIESGRISEIPLQ